MSSWVLVLLNTAPQPLFWQLASQLASSMSERTSPHSAGARIPHQNQESRARSGRRSQELKTRLHLIPKSCPCQSLSWEFGCLEITFPAPLGPVEEELELEAAGSHPTESCLSVSRAAFLWSPIKGSGEKKNPAVTVQCFSFFFFFRRNS